MLEKHTSSEQVELGRCHNVEECSHSVHNHTYFYKVDLYMLFVEILLLFISVFTRQSCYSYCSPTVYQIG